MKKIMLFILCLACVLTILTTAVEAKTLAPKGFYPSTAIVVKVNHKTDTVTVRDACGRTWQFYGCEDWHKGDVASILLYDHGTARVKDDMIVMARYSNFDFKH